MLTVVTLVKDRNEMLGTFLRGFAAQTDRRFEIVVVDAGGLEDPQDIVECFPELAVTTHRLSPGGPRTSTDSIPYSEARNAGAAAGVGEHVVFCDADTIPSPRFVAELHRALDRHRALCTVEVLYLPPLPSRTLTSLPVDWLASVGRPHPIRERPPRVGVRLGGRHELVWGLCMAMRRETFDRSGGFDVSYDGYAGEDTDLARTLAAMRVPVGLVGGAFVLHRHHDSFEPPLQQLRATTDNARRFHDKWGDWPMRGWLGGFRDLGLVDWTPDRLRVIREPTPDEIDAARCTVARPFRTQTSGDAVGAGFPPSLPGSPERMSTDPTAPASRDDGVHPHDDATAVDAGADAMHPRVDEPVSGAPSDNTTLVGVLNSLEEQGFTAQLIAADQSAIQCGACGETSPAADFAVDATRRLEGASDPDDMMTVIGATCPRCGTGGTLVLGYGPNATEEDAAISAELGASPTHPGSP